MSKQELAPTDHFIDFGGRRVRVRVVGEGPPVLLINGLGAHVATWAPLLKSLDGFRAICFDAPGTGRSPSPRSPYAISRIADVALRIMDELGYESTDVLGYSLGGAVAQELAANEPGRVRRLVLACTSCGAGGVPGSLAASLAVSTPIRHYAKINYRLAMNMIHLSAAEREVGYVARQTSNWHQEPPPSLHGYVLQMTAFSMFNSLPWLNSISQPTLVITGAEDRLVPPANSAILAARLPNARLRVFDRWGHYVLQSSESGAGQEVADFFAAKSHATSAAWMKAHAIGIGEMADFLRSAPKGVHPARVTSDLLRRLYPLPKEVG